MNAAFLRLAGIAFLFSATVTGQPVETRREWQIVGVTQRKALATFAEVKSRDATKILIELVPDQHLFGRWSAEAAGGPQRQVLCDTDSGECVSLSIEFGADAKPHLYRAEGARKWFWFYPRDARSETVQINGQLIIADLSEGFATKLKKLARIALRDPRMEKLGPLMAVLEEGRVRPLEPSEILFEAWQSTEAWRRQFLLADKITPIGCDDCDSFEAQEGGLFSKLLAAELERLEIRR